VHLETDCQVLVSLWSNRLNQRSEINSLLQQMDDLSRSFVDFRLNFINRDCNKVAHECACMVSREKGGGVAYNPTRFDGNLKR
jgi:hypothetical protein